MKFVKRTSLLALAAGLSTLFLSGAALSQQTPTKPTDLGPYDPLGIHAGSFWVYPGVDASLSHTDNVYSSSVAKSDSFTTLTPYVSLRSDWGRHALSADARLIGNYYSKYSTENTTASVVSANGRIDASSAVNLVGSLSFADLSEPRSEAPQFGVLAKPTEYKKYNGSGGINWSENRLHLSAIGSFDTWRYQSNQIVGGPVLTGKDRDHTVYAGAFRGEYTYSPATFLFAELDINKHDYQLSPSAAPVSRNASGYTFLTGVRYDLTRLLVGQIGFGYLKQDYKQAGFKSTSGLALNTDIAWNITPLIVLRATANRAVNDAGIAGASAYTTTAGSIGAKYEWRRNISFSADLNTARDKYVGVSRGDKRSGFNVGGDWKINHLLNLYVRVTHLKQTSSGALAGRGFSDTIGTIGLRIAR